MCVAGLQAPIDPNISYMCSSSSAALAMCWGLLADRPRSASHHRCDGKAVRLFTVSMKRRRQRRSICLSQTEVLCWTTWPAGLASVHNIMNSSAMTIRLHNCICEEHDVWALTIIDQRGRPAYCIFTLTAQSLHANGAEIGTPICSAPL